MDYVSTESTRFNAIVIILVLKGILAKLTFKNATVTLVKMVLHVLMESMITPAIVLEDTLEKIVNKISKSVYKKNHAKMMLCVLKSQMPASTR